MKAIILTFDDQVGFAELVYKKYKELWSNCPFTFRVPFNDENECESYEFFSGRDDVELVKSNSDIAETMKALLDGPDDEDWVYWCIDDRYPVTMDAAFLGRLAESIGNGELEDYNAVKLYNNCPLTELEVTILGSRFFVQQPQTMQGFWNHHFCRVKYIKYFFFNEYEKCLITEGGNALFHEMPYVPMLEKVIVSGGDKIVFGEPCIGGEILASAVPVMQEYGCPLPNYRRR